MKKLITLLIIYTVAILGYSFLHISQNKTEQTATSHKSITTIVTEVTNNTYFSKKRISSVSTFQASFIKRNKIIHQKQIRKTNKQYLKTKEKPKNLTIKSSKESDLWKPTFGDAIKRSTAKAYFKIFDAIRNPLIIDINYRVRLWRQLNDELWIEDHATYDPEKSLIKCEGYLNQGLEPGYYTLIFDGDVYGNLNLEFKIDKDEIFNSQQYLPNYHKIITLHFVDHKGKNIKYINNYPSVSYQREESPQQTMNTNKLFVLHNNNIEISPDIDLRIHQDSEKIPNFIINNNDFLEFELFDPYQKYLIETDGGKYYLNVFTGNKNKITYTFDTTEKKAKPFVLEITFDDNSINYIKVKMNAIDIDLESSILSNEENPGNKDALIRKVKKSLEEKNTFDLYSTGISFQLKDTIFPLSIEYRYNSNFFGPDSIKNQNGLVQFNIYNYNADSDNILQVRWTDKKIFYTTWETIPVLENQLS